LAKKYVEDGTHLNKYYEKTDTKKNSPGNLRISG
jgi:hypothetical protein